eukprot:13907521-Alexandrium_andersonii.AAC.1
MSASLVGSEMCIRDRTITGQHCSRPAARTTGLSRNAGTNEPSSSRSGRYSMTRKPSTDRIE